VDSTPTLQGPPSSTSAIGPGSLPKESSTCSAAVGLSLPDRLALGAASGRSVARSSRRATGCAGTRMARLSSPALASSDTGQLSRRGRTRVSGPGQNRAASRSARASSLTSDDATAASGRCTISGLKLGRPFTAKIAATARSFVASAPSP